MAQSKERWKDRDHGHERRQERRASNEAELLHPVEIRTDQHVEGRGAGESAQHDALTRACRRHLERVVDARAEPSLFVKPEEHVDTVVDAEADHDRDEHHGEHREMPDRDRDESERPQQAQREHRQHDQGFSKTPKREQQEPKREREGQDRRKLTVVEGDAHPVGRERWASGDAGPNIGKLGAQARDLAANLGDGGPIIREPAAATGRIGDDVEETLVVGQEVAGVLVSFRGCQHRAPWRAIEHRVTGRLAHLRDEHREELDVAGRGAILESEIEKVAGEGASKLTIHAVEKRRQSRRRDERFDEVLMIVDLLPELLQRWRRQVEQPSPIEVLQRHAIGQVIERDGPGAQVPGEAGGERSRLLERPASYHDDDLVELAEGFRVLAVAGHIRLARRQQVKLGRFERESCHRDQDGGCGTAEREREYEAWAPYAQSHRAAQRSAHECVHHQSPVGLQLVRSAARLKMTPARPTLA